jgi:hypothetical protein
MEQWLIPTSENLIPNIEKFVNTYNDYNEWLHTYNPGDSIPNKYLGVWDDPELELARSIIHDFGSNASRIAKLMLVLNNEYEIKVKVE